MKHLLLILVLIIIGYVASTVIDPEERKTFVKQASRHALRLGGLLLGASLLIWLALHLSSTPLF